MDNEELRRLIRSSLKKKLREETTKKTFAPKSFEDFKIRLFDALSVSGVDFSRFNENNFFDQERLYEVWSNIETELHTLNEEEKKSVWNESVDYYVAELIEQMQPKIYKRALQELKIKRI